MPKIFALCAALATAGYLIVSCSEDKPSAPEPEIRIQFHGKRSVEAWSDLSIKITATSRSGDETTIQSRALPENCVLREGTADTLMLSFFPTHQQIGTYPIWIIAGTESISDSALLTLTVLPESPATSTLIPLALGNYWVYQSVHNRLDLDTVKLIKWNRSEARGFWEGTFYPTLPIFKDGLRVENDHISAVDLGPQFAIPPDPPDSDFVFSRGLCYQFEDLRTIQAIHGTMTVPAGTFPNVFKYTTNLTRLCDGGESEVIIEEIYIAKGVGIIKSTQIRSSHCQTGCSSRWELLAYKLN